jgi:crotonobetainyl-CoA:carnitine CoA-transferase CaiB-like acyl-CoA transferase
MSEPLAGIRVLDFGQGIAGPYCAQLLGDQGADVIKIEPPRGDWSRTMGTPQPAGMTGSFVAVNRNKRGLCLDLRHPQARDIARALADDADVVVESFRPAVMDRLGLGFETLRAANPRLVYCSITGFGESGPNVDVPASDSVMQPYGGLMSINGERDGVPLRMGNVVSDMLAGANAMSGVCLALLARAASGCGRKVSVALLDSIVAFQAAPISEYLVTGKTPQRLGNDHPMTTPSGVFATRDGAISLTVMEHMWPSFCQGIGAPRLVDDARFANGGLRQQHRDALRAALAPVLASRTTTAWIAALRALDILCAPINDYPALVTDPQVVHNALIQWTQSDLAALPMLRNPVRLEGNATRMTPPPRLGQHSREILSRDLRYSEDQVTQAIGRFVIESNS